MNGPVPAGRVADFLIAGEAKCGSTTLWELLRGHPRVFFPEDKELHFFSSYSDFPGHGRYETDGIGPYLRHFSAARADQRCGDATANYLFDAGACARIARAMPDVRILATLRNPVDRAWSHYWHQVRRGWEKLSFEDALEAEAGRLASGDENTRARFSYQARGHYIESLRRYEAAFCRAQICVVFLEDLRMEPKAVYEAVCRHLGLDAAAAGEAERVPHANRARYPRWLRLGRATRSLRRWAEARGPAVALPVRWIGRATRPLRVYSGAPRMNENTAAMLRQRFAASDRALEAWLGRPLPWGREPA